MISVLIADDEAHARERLKNLLAKYDFLQIDYEAKSGDEVIQILISQQIDVAFLDINMPGVSVFKTISSIKNPPIIIFQTAYSEYAVSAFGINALDYLLKPITEERLEQTIQKIQNALKIGNNSIENKEETNQQGDSKIKQISVNTGRNIKIIPTEDIFQIAFEDGVTFIYIKNERFISTKFLNYYEDKLDENFFRVSRNDIINLKLIESFHPMFNGTYLIELKNGKKIKLSRRRAKELKKIIDF